MIGRSPSREIDPGFPIVYMTSAHANEWGSRCPKQHPPNQAVCVGPTSDRRLQVSHRHANSLGLSRSKSRVRPRVRVALSGLLINRCLGELAQRGIGFLFFLQGLLQKLSGLGHAELLSPRD